MYHHIEGLLAALTSTRAVVEACGVGYECRIPLSTYSALKGREGSKVRLFTHLHVLEDDLRLYGFVTERERELFRLTTAISGVGPSTALGILASFDPAAFASAVVRGDSRALQKIKGVGPKLSERLVLELKDRTAALSALAGAGADRADGDRPDDLAGHVLDDAVAILSELGFSPKEAKAKAQAAAERLKTQAGEGGAPVTVEAIVQAALQGRG